MSGEVVTDSAGTTCRYTLIEDLEPGDVVIIGWRSTVERVEVDGQRARVWWEGNPQHPAPYIDQWNPIGTPLPVEVK